MSVPYTFAPGAVIASAQVNANFAYVLAQIGIAGVSSFNTRTGPVNLTASDVVTANTASVSSPGGAAAIGTHYAALTASGAIALTLPALSGLTVGQYIEVADAGYNAGTNNVTITAAGADVILDHGASGSSFVLNVSNTIARFIVTASGWRVIVYGS